MPAIFVLSTGETMPELSVFKWDANALLPDQVTIDFGDKKDPDKVVFYEFPRTELLEFVEGASANKLMNDKNERRTIKEVSGDQTTFLCYWLSKSCRDVKPPEFFAERISYFTATIKFVEMLTALNHTDEIIASGGNWLALPAVLEFLQKEKVKESLETPVLTSEA
jgi:hypothetical protein